MKKIVLLLSIILSAPGALHGQYKVNFSEKFKKENQGNYEIEINEVKELIHVMIAITQSALENDDMVEQKGKYYQDVLAHFKPYGNEKIIKTFDSLLVASLYNYIFLTGNGISYDFKGSKLIKSNVYDFPATTIGKLVINENPVAKYKNEIEAFALKSNFREFYAKHKPYYNEIISTYDKNANLGRQWKWLEKNFETTQNSFIIFCSPLINSLNYTGDFENNNFKLIYMVLPPLDKLEKLSERENELLNTRVMFTEIDHNYVKAPTLAHQELVDRYFKDRAVWTVEGTEGVSAYPTPEKVFDEYMTYAVFVLYCKDNYSEKDFLAAKQSVIDLMKERGFPKMEEFTNKLLKVRSENPGKKIDNVYPMFLKQFEQ